MIPHWIMNRGHDSTFSYDPVLDLRWIVNPGHDSMLNCGRGRNST